MNHRSFIRTFLMTTTVLSPGAAFAQGDEPFLLDRISVTATKTEEPAIDALSGSSVISSETLDNFEPDDVSEIFKGVPGVETQSDGNDPGTAINIRGLQDFGRVNVLVEGARQDFQRSGHGADGVFYLDPELVKQVDITRGPVSTIFGSGAIGGVVNFELIDASDILDPEERMGAVIKGGHDTNDEGYLVSAIGAAQADGGDILGNFIWRDDDDFEDGDGGTLPDTSDQITSGLLKGNIRPTEGLELTGVATFSDNSYQTGDTDFSNGFLRETETEVTNFVAKLQYEAPNTSLVNLNWNGYFSSTDTEQTQIEASNSVPAGNVRTFDVDTTGFDIHNTSGFLIGSVENAFTIGVDFFRDEVETDDPLGTGDEFTPSGEREVLGGFIQHQANFDDFLTIIGAVRFDEFDLSGEGLNLEGENTAPKVTVGVTPFEGIEIFGTYAEGFRAPAITEVFNNGIHDPSFPFAFLPNPDLKPETAENYEVGANLKFDGVMAEDDRFRAKIVYFDNSIENFIEGDVRGLNPFTCFALPNIPQFFPGSRRPVFLPPSGCGEFQYINITEAQIDGIEVQASYEVGNFYSTFAYSSIDGVDESTGEPLTSVRPDTFSATLAYRLFEDSLTLGGRVTAVEQQEDIPSDGLPGLQGDSYELVDLFAHWEPNATTRYSIVLNNITDEQYTKYLDVNASEGFSATFRASFKIGG